MTETVFIEFSQKEITNILVCYLQDKGKISENVFTEDINIRLENGEIKCTIKGVR
jgi:mannitol/fructose-specific phosphotransferase system IIA component (Ntr-type)